MEKSKFTEAQNRRIRTIAAQWTANRILIEQAGSGLSLIQELNRSSALKIIGTIPKHDKPTRLMSVSAIIEAGRVMIPKETPWLIEFRRELTLFPNARHDDHGRQSVAVSQVVRGARVPMVRFWPFPDIDILKPSWSSIF